MPDTSKKELSISDLLDGDIQLVSPPNIYFELQKIIGNPNKNLADAAFVIEKDASLAIRLLKIVNSAFYGFPSKIASIDRAINLIGSKELQSIALSTVVIDRFSDLPDELISMHDFWARNLRCALIAQGIDHYLGKEFTDSVFICGILHNIGQLIFFRRIPELAKKVSLISQQQKDLADADEIEIERNIIGFDHYQTGAALTKRWKLPNIITESIRLHPYPDYTEPNYKIAAIVRLADFYSKIEKTSDENGMNSFDISANDLSNIIENAYIKFEEIFKIFYPK